VIIANNTIRSNRAVGIALYDSGFIDIVSNEIRDNGGLGGIILSGSNRNNITNNDFTLNEGWATELQGSNENELYGNTFTGDTNGIMIQNSRENEIRDNELNSIGLVGMYLSYADKNTITSNDLQWVNDTGIFIGEGSNQNTITNNICSNGNGTGIELSIADHHLLQDNICSQISGSNNTGPLDYRRWHCPGT